MSRTNGRCWIIGNGLSLRETPLDLLIGEKAFGVNRISMAFEWTDWRPTYYVKAEFNDDDVFLSMRPNLENPDCHNFISVNHAMPCEMQVFPRFPINVTYFNMRCLHVGSNAYNGIQPEEWHLPQVCEFGGVSNIAIQIAAMMEVFSEIYLVGMDLGWKTYARDLAPDPNHFDAGYGEWDMFPLDEKDATQILYWEVAKMECEKRGIKVYNATVGGKLEVFERVKIEDVICQ